MTLPACFQGDPRAGVIVDFGGITHKAFHAGISKMSSIVAGRLAKLLSAPLPAWIAVAVDPRGRVGRRHAATAHLPVDERYKAGRSVKPDEFWAQSALLLDVIALHRIPILWPADYAEQTYEADDAAAAAVRLARADGLSVALLSDDKDWAQLVTDEHPRVVLWDGRDGVRTEASVSAMPAKGSPGEHGDAFGVTPCQLPDWQAMVGDSSDNVLGAGGRVNGQRQGIGPVSATRILRAYGSLDAALAAEVMSEADRIIARGMLDKDAGKLSRERRRREEAAAGKAMKKSPIDDAAFEALAWDVAHRRERLALQSDLAQLQAHRDAAMLSRSLVTLDSDAPIAWDRDELPVGSFDVAGLRRAYRDEWGWSALAGEVRTWPKRPLPGRGEAA